MQNLSIENILKKLISFKSISGSSNLSIVEYLEDLAKSLGFRTHRLVNPHNAQQANLLCEIGPSNQHGLMLCGHLDVVPVAGQDWQSDPFVLTSKEDKYIGRGVLDMKGFIASCFNALSSLNLNTIKNPLSLLFTYDEENGCHGSKQASIDLNKFLEFMPKSVLIGEPTDFGIIRMHKGHISISLDIIGKPFHSSMPDRGISAIKILNRALNALFDLEKELINEVVMPEFFERPFVVMNVGVIHAGNAINIVPERAQALIGIRPLPQTNTQELFRRIHEAIFRANYEYQSHISLKIMDEVAALFCQEHTMLENYLKPLANVSYKPAVDFATDGGNLAKTGMDCLIFGPGSISVAHTANEWIYKKDLALASNKLQELMRKMLF